MQMYYSSYSDKNSRPLLLLTLDLSSHIARCSPAMAFFLGNDVRYFFMLHYVVFYFIFTYVNRASLHAPSFSGTDLRSRRSAVMCPNAANIKIL